MKRILLSALCFAAIAALALPGCERKASAPVPAPALSEAQQDALRSSIATALAEPDPDRRVHNLASLLPGIPAGAGPELKRVLEIGSKRGMGVAEYELLVRAWAAQDPEAASNWVLEQSGSHLRVSAILAAVEAWARTDPRAAVANVTWAAQIADREVAQAVQQGIVRGWFQTDREGLERYMDDLGTGIEQQRALLAYAFALYRADGPDGVMHWAQSIPEEKEAYKRSVYRQVAFALAWADPPAAEHWCDAECEGPYGKSLRTTIIRVRIQNAEEPAAILEWLGGRPESESQLQALRVGFQLWAIKNESAAMRWMRDKIAAGPEPWVKKLYGAYARQLAPANPAEALRYAAQVDDERTRAELMVRIARKWRRADRAAADAWIDGSPLSEEQRANARDVSQPDYLPDAAPGDEGEPAV